MIQTLATDIPAPAKKLMNTFWPGHLTLVFKAKPHIPKQLTAGTGKIGIRIPIHPVARALVSQVDFPITGTSANLSGQPGCTRIEDLAASIRKNVHLILDAGPVKGGIGSTIVDVTQTPVAVLRQGKNFQGSNPPGPGLINTLSKTRRALFGKPKPRHFKKIKIRSCASYKYL